MRQLCLKPLICLNLKKSKLFVLVWGLEFVSQNSYTFLRIELAKEAICVVVKQSAVSFQVHYVLIRLCYCVYIRHFFGNTVYLVEIGKANIFWFHHCPCLD